MKRWWMLAVVLGIAEPTQAAAPAITSAIVDATAHQVLITGGPFGSTPSAVLGPGNISLSVIRSTDPVLTVNLPVSVPPGAYLLTVMVKGQASGPFSLLIGQPGPSGPPGARGAAGEAGPAGVAGASGSPGPGAVVIAGPGVIVQQSIGSYVISQQSSTSLGVPISPLQRPLPISTRQQPLPGG